MNKKLILKSGVTQYKDHAYEASHGEVDMRRFLYNELKRFGLSPDEPCCSNDDVVTPGGTFTLNPLTLVNNVLTISGEHNGTAFSQSVTFTPTRFFRDVFLNPVDGTTIFTLTNSITSTFPPIVSIGGTLLVPTDFSITGNTLTLTNPIVSSIGGAGGSDVIVQYSY